MANIKVNYPASGKPETIKLSVVGSTPTNDEIQMLTSIKFEKKAASKEEVKLSLKWFAAGIVIAIFGWFFGGWVIDNFIGPGVLFFGYGAKYIASPIGIIFGFVSLFKIFRSARKRKAFDAMKWVWMTSIIGDDSVGERFGKLEYAVSTMRRIIPSAVDLSDERIATYISEVRDAISKAADITTVPTMDAMKDWNSAGPITDFSLIDETEIAPGAKQLHAVLSYWDQLSKSDTKNNIQNMVTAEIEIDIQQTYICAEGYWFPYEITSPIKIDASK